MPKAILYSDLKVIELPTVNAININTGDIWLTLEQRDVFGSRWHLKETVIEL